MVKVPSAETLRKYGLSLEDWLEFIPVPEGVERTEANVLEHGYCVICKKQPATGRMVVDHFHAAKWKKMPPAERKKWVRGVVCTTDNRVLLTRYGTIQKHLNAAEYLEAFEKRRAAWPSS